MAHYPKEDCRLRYLVKGQVRTVVELITKGALYRCIRLAEAYKVIANITRELEQDFPNKTILHLGRANNDEAALEEKARSLYIRLVNSIQLHEDVDFLLSEALAMLDSDTVTSYPFARFLKDTIYAF